jgi:hypothetical protein
MNRGDQRPLRDRPGADLIVARGNDNRLGAVYSSLNAFWISRHAALNAPGQQGVRRDAYSVIMFNDVASTHITNDFNSFPDQLLDVVTQQGASGGTNFDAALVATEALMKNNWSTER